MKKSLLAAAALLCLGAGTAPQFTLAWDYPPTEPERTNIVFEVWRSTSPASTNWQRFAVTAATNLPFMATGACGFFKVRASNTFNGLVSEWGH